MLLGPRSMSDRTLELSAWEVFIYNPKSRVIMLVVFVAEKTLLVGRKWLKGL